MLFLRCWSPNIKTTINQRQYVPLINKLLNLHMNIMLLACSGDILSLKLQHKGGLYVLFKANFHKYINI